MFPGPELVAFFGHSLPFRAFWSFRFVVWHNEQVIVAEVCDNREDWKVLKTAMRNRKFSHLE